MHPFMTSEIVILIFLKSNFLKCDRKPKKGVWRIIGIFYQYLKNPFKGTVHSENQKTPEY